jgi:hypothetical protein
MKSQASKQALRRSARLMTSPAGANPLIISEIEMDVDSQEG